MELDELREIISALEGNAFYPPVAITEEYGVPMVVCANGHAWGSIDYTTGCPRCLENHAFRLKGRTECEEDGCHELVTCSDRLWEEGNRKCKMHWTRAGDWEVGPVSCDDTMAVLAQYNPRNRWNGWIAAPWMDAYSVAAFIDDLNERMGAKGPADTFLYDWVYEEDNDAWVLQFTDPYGQDTEDAEQFVPEYYPPDEDGLYTFGNGWVWSEDPNYGATKEWLDWSSEHTRVWVQASNENNQLLIEQRVQDRFALNEAAAKAAVTEWLKDNPEPSKYPNGATYWVDLTGKEVTA